MTRRSSATLRILLPLLVLGAPLAAQDGSVRVCAGGDVTIGTNLDTRWAERRGIDPFPDPDRLLAPLRPLLSDADVVLLNVEGAIGEGPKNREKCSPGSTACYAFRQPVEVAGALRRVAPADAAVVGNVANNHARDDGYVGLRATVRHLEDAGIAAVGTDTLAVPVATASGDTVAFLGFSMWVGPDPRDTAAVRRHVARAAARWPRLAVSVHMGAEGTRAQHVRDEREIFLGSIDRGNPIAFATAAAEAGADVIFGHGPHVMRAVEWREGTLVFHSLGNLATYGPFSFREPIDRGAVACATLNPQGRVVAAELRSTRQRPPGFVEADPEHLAARLAASLARADLPRTAASIGPEGRIEVVGALPEVRPRLEPSITVRPRPLL